MTLNFFGRLAVAACLLLFSDGCDDSGVGGEGTGGGGGTQIAPQLPGLWEGQANGLDVCFYIDAGGLKLEKNAMCNVTGTGQPDDASRSFDLSADLVGTDENGASCSFDLSFTKDVAIEQATDSFRASEIQGGAEVAFSGEITGDQASGVARRDSEGSICRVGWATTKSTECDEAAIESCLDLLDCCRAILVSPVFFESCNSVVLECDQAQCLEVLAGYPQCAPEPEPEMDAGTSNGG
jgi:hypothetical protein